MPLLDEVEKYFGTRVLYDVIGVSKEASDDEIKKAYRKSSLKIHPDRVEEAEKAKATEKFQVLAQVHHVLSDSEKRKLYDDHGIIANDDSLESEADWSNYWRLLFPEISEKDIDNFMSTYIGSDEEKRDLIELYNRFKGDLDMIFNYHIGYDETRTVKQLKDLIKEKVIKDYPSFSKESSDKKARRVKKVEREAKEAAKHKKETENLGDLTALIRQRQQGNFNSMIAQLEAKYASKGTKRKRSKPC